MLTLMRDLWRMPPGWRLWLALLAGVNLAGAAFLDTPEGRAVLIVFLVAAAVLVALHKLLGFVRLMGLAHFPWFPLLAWLLTRVDQPHTGETFQTWLWAVIVLNSVSLVIDVVDVARWLRGERAPIVG